MTYTEIGRNTTITLYLQFDFTDEGFGVVDDVIEVFEPRSENDINTAINNCGIVLKRRLESEN